MANADLNMVALTGRLVKEGDLRYSQTGNAVLRFSIAVNRVRRNQDGSRLEEVSYFDCLYFGKAAEAVNQYLEKGRQVAINGELRQSRWEQDGQTRSRIEVYVNSLTLIGGSNTTGPRSDFGTGNSGYTNQNGYQQNQGLGRGQGYGATQGFQRNSQPSSWNNQGSGAQSTRNVPPMQSQIEDSITGGPETFDDDVIPF